MVEMLQYLGKHLVCVVILGISTISEALQDANPQLLSNKIQEIVQQNLRHKDMQGYIYNHSYVNTAIDGRNLLNNLELNLRQKFGRRVTVLLSLRSTIATGGDSSRKQCCQLTSADVEVHNSFMQNVTVNRACERISSNAAPSASRITSDFDNAAFQNLQQDPSLKWQYFGSEEGITTIVPGPVIDVCGRFENRFRPWYIEGSTPRTKQIVIAINRGGSMSDPIGGAGSRSRIEVAKDVARILIDSLNPRDEFAVIAFDGIEKLAGCFESRLSLATPDNKQKQIGFVNQLRAEGPSNYVNGIKAAFSYFSSSSGINDTERVVAFISDGTSTTNCQTVFTTLQQKNALLDNSVTMMTFGIGTGTDLEILERLPAQNGSSCEAPTIPGLSNPTVGQYLQIQETNIRNQLTNFFGFFRFGVSVNDPIWTVPYLDDWGLGVVITAALPVYVRSTFAGVVALDMTLNELLEESTFLRPSEMSYAFVVDKFGLVINHPLFPYVTNNISLIVEATAFERDPGFLSVFEDLKAGRDGQKTFVSTHRLADGNDTRYGITATQIESTYFYKKIEGTPFRLCVVVPTGAERATAPPFTPKPPFIYHRIDIDPPDNTCAYKDRYYCNRDHSSVTLSPRSFVRPEEFILTTETAEWIQRMRSYMEGTTSRDDTLNLKEGIRDVVTLTQYAETLWKQTAEDNTVIFRYIATKEGVYRRYPGCVSPRGFDANIQPWFDHAVANRNKFAVTPPYQDNSNQNIVTLSRVLFGSSQSDESKIVGVMGVDLPVFRFQELFNVIYPQCLRGDTQCLLMDKGGFVILPPDDAAELVHITTAEQEVSNALIQAGIMQTQQCSTIEDGQFHRTYKISTDAAYRNRTFSRDGRCFDFSLQPVPTTNIYLLVRSDATSTQCVSGPTGCLCSRSARGDGATCSDDNDACQCPCKNVNTNYDACSNTYSNDSTNTIQPCVPKSIRNLGGLQEELSVSALPTCFASDTGPNIGLVVGLVVGLFSALVLCILLAYVIMRKKRTYTNGNATNVPPTHRESETPSTPKKRYSDVDRDQPLPATTRVEVADYEDAEYANPYLDIVN